MRRAGELARCRAAANLSEDDCLVWFGVGRSTLERIESGEVIPSEAMEAKINRFLAVCGGNTAALPDRPAMHDGGPLNGGGGSAPAAFSGDRDA